MEREKVKQILIFCRDVDGEIKHNTKMIQDYEDTYYTRDTPGGDENSGFRSKNKISNPTAQTALNVPDYVRGEIHALHELNIQLGALKAAILHELNVLPLHQKTILYEFYIKGSQWVQITGRVNYSATQCKKLRNRGLEILAQKFNGNDLIKNFNYPS